MANNSLFRRKPLSKILEEGGDGSHGDGGLAKTLKLRDLVSMGVAAVIGAGIFSTIGSAAYNGGPGVVFLFIIAAITCGFTALCYAEFASRVPVAGSAYTYSYVTFGELTAWIIGWALILEYAIGNIVVAISWSSYFNNLLRGVGIHLPEWMATDGGTAKALYETALKDGKPVANFAWSTAPTIGNWHVIFNLPAFVIVVLVTMLVYIGIKESKKWANRMVAFKLLVLLIVIVAGFFYIKPENYVPFMPNGFKGVMMGVSAVFYAYIGFDAISTTAEECENPQRDLPRGMIYALILCTIVYVLTALVITGMVSYKEFLGVADPLAYVFEKTGLTKLNYLISISAVVATTSVLLVFQIGQPRIWMTMSRDGLLPKAFSRVHPKFQTPSFATVVTGFLVAVPALFLDAALMTDLTSIGTLFAFVLVCGGVLVLPTEDKQIGKFKLPYINGQFIIPGVFLAFLYTFQERVINAFANIGNQPHQEYLLLIFLAIATVLTIYTSLKRWSFIPVMGVLFCTYLMIEIPVKSWFVFFGWMALGLLIYFTYSQKNSKLA